MRLIKLLSLILIIFTSICCENKVTKTDTKTDVKLDSTITPVQKNIKSIISKSNGKTTKGSVTVITKIFSVLGKNNDTATFYWPLISDCPKAIADSINKTIDKLGITESSAKDLQSEYADCSCGTIGRCFDVNCDSSTILSISITIETMGAYPDSYLQRLNFNTKTGSLLQLTDLLNKDSLT